MDNSNPYIDIHTHRTSNNEGVAIVNIYPEENATEILPLDDETETLHNQYFSVGIHPSHVEPSENQIGKLTEIANNTAIIAIGECGLDVHSKTSMVLQEEIFSQQIELSEKLGKPLIIHCVRAFNELIRLRKSFQPKMPWILHGFNANIYATRQCLNNNMYFSFGGQLLNDKSNAYEAAKFLPIAMIFLETDDSDLEIAAIYQRLSEIKDIPLEVLKTTIRENFREVFSKP
jgi:TatD DNase family protein